MGSSWTDYELSRMITWRSSAHKKKSGPGAGSGTCTAAACREENCRVTTRIHPEDRRSAGKGHMLWTACEGCDGRAMQAVS
jgi:hypothetical protein